MTEDAHVEPAAFDPRKRRLCPDGACIGVIGPDGRCRVCGTVDQGAEEAFSAGSASGPLADTPARDESDDNGADAEAAADPTAPTGAGFDPQRRLCPDGACVGVIGSDGRCKVCGRHENS